MNLEKFKPAVDKKILILTAGLMWVFTGIMLMSFSITWLSVLGFKEEVAYLSAGFLLAMPVHRFGFLRIADKNLKRLLRLTEKKCFFSFMTWKSYFIIPVMVSFGITLRHSGIPRQYLSIIYNGIGLALFLSGLRYIRYFLLLISGKPLSRPAN